jgi:hypothetical protein
MRRTETYFEQVPKVVVEKMLAQQDPPPVVDLISVEVVKKRPASDAADQKKIRSKNHTKNRKPKP